MGLLQSCNFITYIRKSKQTQEMNKNNKLKQTYKTTTKQNKTTTKTTTKQMKTNNKNNKRQTTLQKQQQLKTKNKSK